MLQLPLKELVILQQAINKRVIYIGGAYSNMAIIVIKGVDDYRVRIINLLTLIPYEGTLSFDSQITGGVINNLGYMRGMFLMGTPVSVFPLKEFGVTEYTCPDLYVGVYRDIIDPQPGRGSN